MIYLDSAIVSEAEAARSLGWVKGITTNPTLLAKSAGSPAETLQQLTAICPGELYYQLMATDVESMIAEARSAQSLIGQLLTSQPKFPAQ
jgi:transaldolase